MNEKFLSRGKREDTGKWVKGYYVELPEEQHEKKLCLIIGLDGQYNRIIPETAGRCAEITDKNNVLIFEGDILRHDRGTLHEVVFEQRNGRAYFGWKISELETWDFDLDFLRQLEVVGNIHDNKQMLGRADMPVSNDVFQPVLQPPENFEIAPA